MLQKIWVVDGGNAKFFPLFFPSTVDFYMPCSSCASRAHKIKFNFHMFMDKIFDWMVCDNSKHPRRSKQFTLMKGYIVLKMSALKFLYGGKLTYYITVDNSTKFSFMQCCW